MDREDLERLRVEASYRPAGDGRIAVRDALIRRHDGGASGSAGAAGRSVFVHEGQRLREVTRYAASRRVAVATFHEAGAFEQVAQLLVLIPCGAPGEAIVAERGFRVGIGRSFVFAIEPTAPGRWLVIGRNHGGDGGAFWGSVWIAELSSGGAARIRTALDYASAETEAPVEVDGYRYDSSAGVVTLELGHPRPERGRESASAGRRSFTVELALPGSGAD